MNRTVRIDSGEDEEDMALQTLSRLVTTPVLRWVKLSTGVRFQYVEQGDPSGTAVVLLHGYVDSWRSFERVLPLLPDSLHVFTITQRGHGNSGRPQAGYRYRDFAQDLAAWMDAIGLESAVIVGHSMGSAIAQRFAIDQPTRARGLLLIGSTTTWHGNPVIEEVWDAVSVLTDPIDPEFVREFQESTLARPVPPVFLESIIDESLKVPAMVWREAWSVIHQTDHSPELSRISVPTLLTWGDQDGMSPRDEQDALLASIAGSRLEIYEGTGHALHWEKPERFAADLVSFIAGLDA
jgi:non-heme chloroperoxidase